MPRCLRVLLVIAILLAVAGSATGLAAPVREPAPPPASCRVEPTASWPALVDGGILPDLVPYQDYRAGLALTDGAAGAGVRIADVEYEWRASHVELAAKGLPAAGVTDLPAAYRVREHGTAVLGVLGGTADGRGITGIAPEATLLPVSPFASGVYRPAESIARAAAGLDPGDVLLVELQAVSGTGAMVPIEVYPEVRAAIAAAVDRGIVVVEPAANSGRDLAAIGIEASLGPNPWAPGTPGEDHSGALIVGAGGAASPLLNVRTVGDRQRTPESNFGARVDLQGFGAGVVTSGYADLPGTSEDTAYTACFDGTSSASATVAGAVAVVQAEAIARFGQPLTPDEVRTLLVETGLPQVMGPSGDGNIGPRPQVAAAIEGIASARGRPPAPAPAPAPAPTSPPPPAAAPPLPAAGGAPAPAPVAATPAPVATGAAAASVRSRPAARRTPRARLHRRSGRLTIRLRGLAPRARVTVNGRRLALKRGVVTLSRVRPRAYLVRVTAPRRGDRRYRPARFIITIPVRGAPRVRGA